MEIYNKDDLSKWLSANGLPSFCVDLTITPQAILYHFDCKDIKDLPKIKRLLPLLSATLHETITQRETKKGHFCIEIPRKERAYIHFSQLHENLKGKPNGEFLLGIDETNKELTYNIDDCPHILVAGATGSGKSIFLNCLISAFCCYSKNLDLILIDPKQVEFSLFEKSCHLIKPIITDTEKACDTLQEICDIMDSRYSTLKGKGLRDNKTGVFSKIVIVVDELADLMLKYKSEVEPLLVRIAQLGRACDIHLVLATQRPTVNVVTGLLKANIEMRIAFAMASNRDSIVMLDKSGADKLQGKGDCLVKFPDKIQPIRVQAPFIDTEYISNIFKNCPERVWQTETETRTEIPTNKKKPNGWQKFIAYCKKEYLQKQYKKHKIGYLTYINELNELDNILEDDE